MTNSLPSYYRQLNTRFLKFLPPNMARVLEFGCSAGMVGKTYKENNTETVWHGVEINSDAAKYAKENLDDAWLLNANRLEPNSEMLKAPYDMIVYGDVIEHLNYPMESIKQHLKLLKPGGELLACIPNIQHWTIMKELLDGNWTYRNSGLLDNTHLRFFTRKSIWKMLNDLKLELVQQERYSYEDVAMFGNRRAERDEILQLLELTNTALGNKHSDLDFRTFQYGIRARKNT